MVEFCPECQNMMRRKKEDGEYIFACDCGFSKPYLRHRKKELTEVDKQRMAKKRLQYKTRIKEKDEIEHPVDKNAQCPKCSQHGAEFFQEQTRSADEPATTFYKCLDCKHKWRDYG